MAAGAREACKAIPLLLEQVHLSDQEELLRQSSVTLSSLSCECLLEVLRGNDGQHVKDVIVPADGWVEVEADSLTVLLQGSFIEEPETQVLQAPLALGEAEFLNIAELPVREKRRVRAVDGDCTVKAIHRDDFQSSLQKFPDEAKVFDRFLREASRFAVPGAPFARVQEAAGRRILAFLEAGREFQGCRRDFLATLCTEAEGVLLAPGETLQAGDLPKGHCSLFIVLAGRIQVATPEGIVFRFAGPGEVLGSASALDLVESSTEAFKALPGMGPAFCVRIPHAAVGRALQDCPSNAELWIKNAELLHREACRSKQERCRWASQVAVPALASTSLLAGCPQDFLMSLAGQLSEVAHSEGDEIFACNTSGKSMMIVLEGCVELHAKSGREIGCVGAGAVIGEPEALGLLSFRTATAVAVTSCRLLPVSFEALTQALSAPTAATLKEGFKQLVEGRRSQVRESLPLSAMLNLRTSLEEDVGAQLLCLRAERLPLEHGICWHPVADSDESGPRYSLVVRGRVAMEVSRGEGEPLDFHVKQGSVIPEGILAAHGAYLRAVSGDCEVYRVWQYDLLQAAHVVAQAHDWFYQLRVLEKETRAWLETRLVSARGQLLGRVPHPADKQIRGWAEKRKESQRRARELQEQLADNYLGPKLPLLPPKKLGTTAFRSWAALPGKAAPRRPPNNFPGPEAFRALKLSKAKSEPRLPPAWPPKGPPKARRKREGADHVESPVQKGESDA
ncbi:Dnaja4 [Symbiodinium sp. CCMP2456]|nr:Dnaja4 [Symbiodinium sp. CCMP2456]